MASVKKRPDGKWRARYRDPGGQEIAKHFARKVDAELWLDTIRANLLTGRYVDPRAGRITFEEYAEKWRSGQPHRPSTASLYERLLRLHAYPVLGHRALSSVRRSEIQAWVAGMTRQSAPATVRQVYSRVRTIFRAAVEDRLIVESPCRRIALPELPDETIVPLTVDQVRLIADAAPADLRALVILAAATGLRSGELLGLTLQHVDFLRRTVAVEQQLIYISGQPPFVGPPKTRSSRRVVPVPTFALEALAAHLAEFVPGEGDFIFHRRDGGPILRTTLHGAGARRSTAPASPRTRICTISGTTTRRCSSTVGSR